MHRAPMIPLLRILSKNPFRQPPKPTSPKPTSARWTTQLSLGALRSFSGGSGEFDPGREVDKINLKFAEAREEIEMAMDSKDTVYFNEEAHCARAAVDEALALFGSLSAKLSEPDRAALHRSMGLKMDQLKAELQQLDD